MEIETVTEIIGHRIVGTGIFCAYGAERLNDSIIEIVQDYMKERKENNSVIDIFSKNELYIEVCIFYCSEHKAKDRYDFGGDVIWIFSSFEEFKRLNDIDDKIKSLDYIHSAYRKHVRKHNDGYVSRIIY